MHGRGHREENCEFSQLIRILQWLPSEAEMRGTDERRGSGGPEIDQNQTGGVLVGTGREGMLAL